MIHGASSNYLCRNRSPVVWVCVIHRTSNWEEKKKRNNNSNNEDSWDFLPIFRRWLWYVPLRRTQISLKHFNRFAFLSNLWVFRKSTMKISLSLSLPLFFCRENSKNADGFAQHSNNLDFFVLNLFFRYFNEISIDWNWFSSICMLPCEETWKWANKSNWHASARWNKRHRTREN